MNYAARKLNDASDLVKKTAVVLGRLALALGQAKSSRREIISPAINWAIPAPYPGQTQQALRQLATHFSRGQVIWRKAIHQIWIG